MARELLVFGTKTFKISVPDDAKLTFGPFSPPTRGGYERGGAVGTLRVYRGDKPKDTGIIAVFSNISGFRDLSLEYMEEVAKEEGATIWKHDKDGYTREEKVQRDSEWVAGSLPPAPEPGEEVPF